MINGVARYGMPSADGGARRQGPDGARGRQDAPAVPGAGRPATPTWPNVSLQRGASSALTQGLPRPAQAGARAGEAEAEAGVRAPRCAAAGGLVAGARRDPGTGVDQRPRLPFDGPRDFTGPDLFAARSVGAAVDHSAAHQAGPADRGRRSELPDADRRAAERARSDPQRVWRSSTDASARRSCRGAAQCGPTFRVPCLDPEGACLSKQGANSGAAAVDHVATGHRPVDNLTTPDPLSSLRRHINPRRCCVLRAVRKSDRPLSRDGTGHAAQGVPGLPVGVHARPAAAISPR